MNKVFLILLMLLFQVYVFAQQKTDNSTVDIVSEYNPKLKGLNKINITASPAAPEGEKPKLQYNIPNQNLEFAYRPGLLRPLTLTIDEHQWSNSSYIKLGYGNLNTPFAQAGLSFGDGKTSGLNIYGKYTSSEGKRQYQDYRKFDAKAAGFYKTPVLEWSGSVEANNFKTKKYGFEPETLTIPLDSLHQEFQTFKIRTGIRNVSANALGIDYSPELKIDLFADNHKAIERSFAIGLPFSKKINDAFAAKLAFGYDYTVLKATNQNNSKTAVLYIQPVVQYKSPTFSVDAGIRPSWDNSRFVMLPAVKAQVGTADQRFTILGGFEGRVKKNTYQYFAETNPWLWSPDTLFNTTITELYGGVKGSLSNHFSYSAKIGVNNVKNQPLYLNDISPSGDGKSFQIVRERKMNIMTLGGEVGYNVAEQFSLLAGVTANTFSGLKDNAKAWGLSPMEIKGSVRYNAMKDLWIKADALGLGGAHFLSKTGQVLKMKDAFDISLGAEMKVYKGLGLWLQFNNIFNQQYQRWNQYPVYGFNFLGGVVYSFSQKK